MDQTRFCELLDELFELDAGTVQTGDVMTEISGWSSLTLVGLIAMMDEECGVTMPPKVILNCKTVGDLLAQIQQRLGGNRAAA
jgi:acyl carrier protein